MINEKPINLQNNGCRSLSFTRRKGRTTSPAISRQLGIFHNFALLLISCSVRDHWHNYLVAIMCSIFPLAFHSPSPPPTWLSIVSTVVSFKGFTSRLFYTISFPVSLTRNFRKIKLFIATHNIPSSPFLSKNHYELSVWDAIRYIGCSGSTTTDKSKRHGTIIAFADLA